MAYSTDLRHHKKTARQWLSCKTVADVAALMQLSQSHLQLLLLQPSYHVFERMKADKTFRTIEAPVGQAKKVLLKLNHYMQSCYYFCKTTAAHGFVMSMSNDPDPRNIVSNATKHLGCRYLLNVDLEDFFHQVTTLRVSEIFSTRPLKTGKDLAAWLTNITTYNGRLPMGSPTSPVLSNFATIGLDQELTAFAIRKGLTYTRYVDDLSFSGANEITDRHFNEIESIIQSHGFVINYDKKKLYAPHDTKIITGLYVDKKVEVSPEFLENMEEDINRLKNILEVHQAYGANSSTMWLEEFEKQVNGKLSFLSMVYGKNHEIINGFERKLDNAYKTDGYLESRSWLDFNYEW